MKKYKWIVPTIYIIFLMLPIYWLLNMSFKTTTEIINTYTLWPNEFTLENYKKILILILPAVPHLSSEFLEYLGSTKKLNGQ